MSTTLLTKTNLKNIRSIKNGVSLRDSAVLYADELLTGIIDTFTYDGKTVTSINKIADYTGIDEKVVAGYIGKIKKEFKSGEILDTKIGEKAYTLKAVVRILLVLKIDKAEKIADSALKLIDKHAIKVDEIKPKEIEAEVKPYRRIKTRARKVETLKYEKLDTTEVESLVKAVESKQVTIAELNREQRVQCSLIKNGMKIAKAYGIDEDSARLMIAEALKNGALPESVFLKKIEEQYRRRVEQLLDVICNSVASYGMAYCEDQENGQKAVEVAYDIFSDELAKVAGKNLSNIRKMYTKNDAPGYKELLIKYGLIEQALDVIAKMHKQGGR